MSILAALQKAAPYMRAAALGAAGKPIGDPQDQIRIAMLRQQSMRQVEDQKQKELDRTMAEEQFRQRMAAEQARLAQDQSQFETTEANKQAAAGQSHEYAMELQKLVNAGRISEAQAREAVAIRELERRQAADKAKQEESSTRRQNATATILSATASPEDVAAAIAELKDMGALDPELLEMRKFVLAEQQGQGGGAAAGTADPNTLRGGLSAMKQRAGGILESLLRGVMSGEVAPSVGPVPVGPAPQLRRPPTEDEDPLGLR